MHAIFQEVHWLTWPGLATSATAVELNLRMAICLPTAVQS